MSIVRLPSRLLYVIRKDSRGQLYIERIRDHPAPRRLEGVGMALNANY
jgi:hypothetical protein